MLSVREGQAPPYREIKKEKKIRDGSPTENIFFFGEGAGIGPAPC